MANQRKNNNKMNMNMSRPSMLWLYGLIGAFIIGYYVFGDVNDTPVPSDWATVERMVEKGEVEKIQVVNRDQAQVFLKKEAVEQYRRDTVDKRFRRLPETGVQLLFTIGSVDSFREDLKAAEQQSGQVVPVVYENKANDWTNVLINLLPWVLIIGVWIFVMRSMSRGAGGGAGGGIMNVGKAKVKDEHENKKTATFADVAGADEEKEELQEILETFLREIGELTGVLQDYDFSSVYTIHEEYRGDGWGKATPECVQQIYELAQTEGIYVEQVYTSKTLYGMLDMVRKGLVDGSACYLHTGGFSALFSQF